MNESAKPFDYIEEAHVTASDKYYGDRVPLAYFAHVVGQAVEALAKLDEVKKAVFYGREVNLPKPANEGEHAATIAKLPQWISDHPDNDEKARNIIHAIIGKATEAGELLEALHATAVSGAPFDVANAGEEIGDGFWYDALLARACGLTFDGIQRTNIAKLRHRFPDRFTEYDANNRDLFGERRILEEGEKEPNYESEKAKVLFDFMGWLTTRDERLILSAKDNAAPAAEAIKEFLSKNA